MPIANVLVGDATIEFDAGAGPIGVGYTVDGATLSIRSDFANIKVEELAGTVIRALTDQEVTISFTMAEATLANLEQAIPGCELAPPILTIGGGDLQEVEIILTGTAPGPVALGRVITFPLCNPTGEIGMPFKKGEISVVPVTFSVLCDNAGVFGTIDDT